MKWIQDYVTARTSQQFFSFFYVPDKDPMLLRYTSLVDWSKTSLEKYNFIQSSFHFCFSFCFVFMRLRTVEILEFQASGTGLVPIKIKKCFMEQPHYLEQPVGTKNQQKHLHEQLTTQTPTQICIIIFLNEIFSSLYNYRLFIL